MCGGGWVRACKGGGCKGSWFVKTMTTTMRGARCRSPLVLSSVSAPAVCNAPSTRFSIHGWEGPGCEGPVAACAYTHMCAGGGSRSSNAMVVVVVAVMVGSGGGGSEPQDAC